MLSIATLFLAVLMAGLLQSRSPPVEWPFAMQRGLLFWCVGIQSLLTAYSHTGLAYQTALALGRTPGSTFQFELGMAYLAFGFLGVFGEWIASFRTPTAVAYPVFAIGCGSGYLYRLAQGMPASFSTALYAWISDAFIPFILLALTFWTLREVNKKSF